MGPGDGMHQTVDLENPWIIRGFAQYSLLESAYYPRIFLVYNFGAIHH